MSHLYRVTTPGDPVYVHAATTDEALDLVPTGTLAVDSLPWLADCLVCGTDDLEPEDGAPLTPADREQHPGGSPHPRTAEVRAWTLSYNGRNAFVLNVQHGLVHGRGKVKNPRLSYKQVEALAVVKDREAAWADEKVKARMGTGIDLYSALPDGTTRAAALNEDGGLSFVRLDKVTTGRWAGWVFVRAILGADEDRRLGAHRPGEADYAGAWPTVIRNVLADVPAAVVRYGLELGVCGVCNRTLTNEESRATGIGPICRARLDKGETLYPDTNEVGD